MNLTDGTRFGLSDEQLRPHDGWHCSHFFYRFDRQRLAQNPADQAACDQFIAALTLGDNGPQRLQLGLVSGHKADFSLMVMDPDPIKIESVHQNLMASLLGPALETTWSYVSISEVSEYALSVDGYRQRLIQAGETEASELETRVDVYAKRLVKMNYNRLTPDFPLEQYPVSCFYPMNKWRYPGANWFSLSSSERQKLMSEHARSGMKFAGKVTQLITVGIGIDDWEWGVTLWATNPMHLKQIVYDMRFDEASAKYAEFGPFYISYISTPEQVLETCRIA